MSGRTTLRRREDARSCSSRSAASALPGCSLGSDSASAGDDDADKRGAAITCLTEEKDLDARRGGRQPDPRGRPGDRARGSSSTSRAGRPRRRQFEGEGEGAEQIGSALLFVRKASDDVLEDVEACLSRL